MRMSVEMTALAAAVTPHVLAAPAQQNDATRLLAWLPPSARDPRQILPPSSRPSCAPRGRPDLRRFRSLTAAAPLPLALERRLAAVGTKIPFCPLATALLARFAVPSNMCL
jgi:hypothetical protein